MITEKENFAIVFCRPLIPCIRSKYPDCMWHSYFMGFQSSQYTDLVIEKSQC